MGAPFWQEFGDKMTKMGMVARWIGDGSTLVDVPTVRWMRKRERERERKKGRKGGKSETTHLDRVVRRTRQVCCPPPLVTPNPCLIPSFLHRSR